MSELPTILVTNGWKTDRNRKLTSVVIPSTVKTLNAPTKVTFMGKTLNAVPSTTVALQEFSAPNMTSITTNAFYGYTALESVSFQALKSIAKPNNHYGAFYNCIKLTSVNMPNLETISISGDFDGGAFWGCTALQSVSFPELVSITTSSGNGAASSKGGEFYKCSSLTIVNMPKLQSITTVGHGYGLFGDCTSLTNLELPSLTTITQPNNTNSSIIRGCTALATINLPKIQTIAGGNRAAGGAFSNNTNIQSVTLGSPGNPVSSISSYTFGNDTQAGLTITVYTTGGASLSGSPWGATNATIVYETA